LTALTVTGGSVTGWTTGRLLTTAAFVAFEVFQQIGIEDRGADFVDAHGPLAEVDAAATVTAEGEVFVGGLHQLFAGGAMEWFDFGGLGHRDSLTGLALTIFAVSRRYFQLGVGSCVCICILKGDQRENKGGGGWGI
jgi:hypothetical protein